MKYKYVDIFNVVSNTVSFTSLPSANLSTSSLNASEHVLMTSSYFGWLLSVSTCHCVLDMDTQPASVTCLYDSGALRSGWSNIGNAVLPAYTSNWLQMYVCVVWSSGCSLNIITPMPSLRYSLLNTTSAVLWPCLSADLGKVIR